jgi:predicted nucleic acid-binding protein
VVSTLHQRNSKWEAPVLWKSEFLNVLALYFRKGVIDRHEGLDAFDFAERLVGTREHPIDSREVLDTMAGCSCSSYDCEFVVLARKLGTSLITYDRKLLKEFPQLALTPENYLQQ